MSERSTTSAQYLVRFDDICPTMNWAIWSRIDAVLCTHNIKPLLAVVPDNQDPSLAVGLPRNDFWDYIRNRQSLGWSIAMHGWQHLYETSDPGLLRINKHSEFAGLPYQVQREKIEKAAGIFAAENVRIDAWVAPGHNFDAITLKVLHEFDIRIVSDGFYWRPVQRLGATWIPQQIWRFRKAPFGTWTVCHHSNQFSELDLHQFESDIKYFQHSIADLNSIIQSKQAAPANWLDHGFAAFWRTALLGKKRLRSLRRPQWGE